MVLVYDCYLAQMGAYSKKPLYRKLGIKPGFRMLIKNAPVEYSHFFEELPEKLNFLKRITTDIDFIHLFVRSKIELEKHYQSLYQALKKDGTLWISWPKGTSSIHGNINRDYIREYVLANGLVDVKVCSLDNDWSGLKFVYRTKDRN